MTIGHASSLSLSPSHQEGDSDTYHNRYSCGKEGNINALFLLWWFSFALNASTLEPIIIYSVTIIGMKVRSIISCWTDFRLTFSTENIIYKKYFQCWDFHCLFFFHWKKVGELFGGRDRLQKLSIFFLTTFFSTQRCLLITKKDIWYGFHWLLTVWNTYEYIKTVKRRTSSHKWFLLKGHL